MTNDRFMLLSLNYHIMDGQVQHFTLPGEQSKDCNPGEA